jgi:hypothetical protein
LQGGADRRGDRVKRLVDEGADVRARRPEDERHGMSAMFEGTSV